MSEEALGSEAERRPFLLAEGSDVACVIASSFFSFWAVRLFGALRADALAGLP
jgi:hypothetical protein